MLTRIHGAIQHCSTQPTQAFTEHAPLLLSKVAESTQYKNRTYRTIFITSVTKSRSVPLFCFPPFHSQLLAFQQLYVCLYFSLSLWSFKMYKICIKSVCSLGESLPSFVSSPPRVPSRSTLKRLSDRRLTCPSLALLAVSLLELMPSRLSLRIGSLRFSSPDRPPTHRLVDFVMPTWTTTIQYMTHCCIL